MLHYVTRLKISIPLALASILAIMLIYNAAAYSTISERWPDQPSSGYCCLNLNVAQNAYWAVDITGWQNGVNAWNDSSAFVSYTWVSNGGDWSVQMTDDYWNSPDTDGVAHLYFDGSTITWAELTLNHYYTENDSTGKVQSIAAHELGHANGLNDVGGCVLLQGDTAIRWGECGVNTPQQDDIDGVNSMY